MRKKSIWDSYLTTASLLAVLCSLGGLTYFIIDRAGSDYSKLFLTATAALLGYLIPLIFYLAAKRRFDQLEEKVDTMHVYLSYSLRDKKLADKLEARLERDGIRVIDLLDEINVGDNISEIFGEMDKEQAQFIYLISNKKPESHHLAKELKYALDHKMKVLPIATTDKVNIPMELDEVKALYIKESFDDVYDQLLKAVKANIEKDQMFPHTSVTQERTQ